MTVTNQDRIVGMYLIESDIATDRRYTKITSAEIAQFIDEYYPEMFENIASDNRCFSWFEFLLQHMTHFAYQELELEWLADNRPISQYNPFKVLAELYCYDSFEDMQKDFTVISDCAIDGFLVF